MFFGDCRGRVRVRVRVRDTIRLRDKDRVGNTAHKLVFKELFARVE